VALGGTALGALPAGAAVDSGAYALPAGSNPSSVAVDPSVHNVYVTHSGDKVTIFDGLNHTSKGTVTVGPYLRGIGVDPTFHRAYVVARGTDWPGPSSIDGKMYALGFDLTGPVVTGTTPIEENVVGVAVDESANRVYLAHSHGIVTVYNGYTLARLATVNVVGPYGGTVTGVAVDSGTHVAHVIHDDWTSFNANYSHVSKIEWTGTAYAETDDVTYSSAQFDGVAVDSSSHTVFLSDSKQDRVTLLGAYGYVSVGNPGNIAVDTSSHTAYVVSRVGTSENSVKVLGPRQTANGTAYSVLASIPVSNPQGIAADSGAHSAHVANSDINSVVRISPTPTTMTLTVLPAAAVAGVTPVTMTASVSPGTANGTVQFYEVYGNYQVRPSGAPVAVNGGTTVSLAPTPAVRISTIGAGTTAIYAVFIPNNVSNHQSSQQLASVTLI
jgi:serine/threonine-protein kinase